jgi:hypothetical protein
MNEWDVSRRRFLRGVGGFGLAPLCSRIDLLAWLQADRAFSGENVEEAHRLLQIPRPFWPHFRASAFRRHDTSSAPASPAWPPVTCFGDEDAHSGARG